MCKSCHQNRSVKHQLPRVAVFGLLILGLALSIHLLMIPGVYWLLPIVVVLVLVHATIISGLVWLVGRLRHGRHDSRGKAGEAAGEPSHVLHNPRAYDWLARIVTLGGEARFRRRTVDLGKLQSGQTVLDVGCGTGTLLVEAAKRVGPSGFVHGVDRSLEMLAHAQRKAVAQDVRAEFHEGSSDCLPFPNASFDVAFCTLTLHHLPAAVQLATIAEMRRVLRPGGRMVIVDMQRTGKIAAAFSHIGLIHLFRSRATIPDWEKIEELLTRQGVQWAGRRAVWGETVCAIVGRTTA